MDRYLAMKRAEDCEREADRLRKREPGFGTPRYRGDPYEAVSLEQAAERYRLIATPVTLDGRPATIRGVYRRFAIVETRDGQISHEWAWPTIALIVAERGGAFRS